MSCVYLIHFDQPLVHARHYIGFSERDVEERFEDHTSGNGARILQVCNERGITYKLARVWKRKGRRFERQLKNGKHVSRLCPICNPKKNGKHLYIDNLNI